jgi:hypothetical protein
MLTWDVHFKVYNNTNTFIYMAGLIGYVQFLLANLEAPDYFP